MLLLISPYLGKHRDEIPPSLPLQKGVPRLAGFGKEGLGEILIEYVWSIMGSLVTAYICENLRSLN